MSAMPLWTSGAMAAAMRAHINGALPETVTGISIDSRTVVPGDAYFAIRGALHDGHDFVAAAIAPEVHNGIALMRPSAQALPQPPHDR